MASKEKLEEYHSKRNFDLTKEPFGDISKTGENIWVIQKHDATNLHYDLRIQIDGVLKSWAVPKGPSLDPSDKRLAIQTEDHPMEYADFEGTIPEKEYGGGTIMVWDAGTYKFDPDKNDYDTINEAYKTGHIKISLKGHKLVGDFMLIRTNQKKANQWLFFKIDDEDADARRNPVSTEPNSVLTGRTLAEIKKEES